MERDVATQRGPLGERRDGAVAVAALIAARRAQDGIPHAVACRALGVSRSWFYKHRNGRLPPRAQRRERLKAEVARLFALHEGKYGSPRITADLRDAGWRVSENTVAALDARAAPGRTAEEEAQGHHPPRQGPLAGTGPGAPGLPRHAAQHQVVRRRHRDPHR